MSRPPSRTSTRRLRSRGKSFSRRSVMCFLFNGSIRSVSMYVNNSCLFSGSFPRTRQVLGLREQPVEEISIVPIASLSVNVDALPYSPLCLVCKTSLSGPVPFRTQPLISSFPQVVVCSQSSFHVGLSSYTLRCMSSECDCDGFALRSRVKMIPCIVNVYYKKNNKIKLEALQKCATL